MTPYPNLDELARRPLKYWNIDGLPELTMGAVWMIWGGSLLIGNALPKGSAASVYWLIVPLLLVTTGTAAHRVTKKLKERITYPRVGYAAIPEPGKATRIAAVTVGGLVAAGIAALVVRGRALQLEHVVVAGTGLVLALAFVIGAIRTRAPHWLWLAASALLLGAGMYVARAGYEGMNWMFVWLGVASAVLGGLRLRRFLKENPKAAGAGQ